VKIRVAHSSVVGLIVAGCVVPQQRYDTVVTRLDREQSQRLAAENGLARAKADLTRLEEMLNDKEKNLTSEEGELAAARLDSQRVSTERDDAVGLVEQLRGELARIGDNLRALADQKKELEAALDKADARAKKLESADQRVIEGALVMRDLSLALAEAITARKAYLTVLDGKPAVRLDAKNAFGPKGTELSPDCAALLGAVGRVLAQRRAAHVELSDLSADGAEEQDRVTRLQHVADALVEKGLPAGRIAVAVPPRAPGSAPDVETPDPEKPPGPADRAASPPETAFAPPPRARVLPVAFQEGPGSIEITVDPSPT
jgi:chromosome segregation ATPase